MSKDNNHDWQHQSERSNTFTLKLIAWIALHTGRGITRVLLYPIVFYYLLFAPQARKSSARYLARVFNKPASLWQIAKHIYYFAATILDRVYFLTDQTDKLDIKIHNFDIVKKYREQNQGVILLGSHLGSFDAMRSMAHKDIKIRLKILMYQQHNQMITRILEALNPEVAASVIDLADINVMFKLNQAVQDGYMIGILGDRAVDSDNVTRCTLLGSETDFPTGAILVASVVKKPVILFYCLYMGGNRYEIYFEELAQSVEIERAERESKIQQWVQNYVDRLEFYIKKAPYNWFNFYNFWHDK